MTSYERNELKNGVYELFHKDTADRDSIVNKAETRRTLTVKDDAVLYEIHMHNGHPAATRGFWGDYFLKLEKHAGSLYTAKYENTELCITVVNSNTIEIEECPGHIVHFYSGGAFWEHKIILRPEIQSEYPVPDLSVLFPPQKQTLTFVRDLTAEDEKKILNVK